jgi:hypothetical protein
MRDDRPEGPNRWPMILGILVVVAVIAVLVFLHLSGAIGPGVH